MTLNTRTHHINLEIAELEKVREKRISQRQDTTKIDNELAALREESATIPKPKGRPQTGEWRKCLGCGKDIYVKKYRMKDGGGRYCKKCYGQNNAKKKLHFDKHQKEILSDYGQMTVVDLQHKWGMSDNYWYDLKKQWEAESITIPTAYADRFPELKENKIRVPTIGDKRRKTYKDEGWPKNTRPYRAGQLFAESLIPHLLDNQKEFLRGIKDRIEQELKQL